MLTIKTTGSIASIIASVRDVPARLVPYAASTALTRCAVIAQKIDLPNAMRGVFDRPTNYALNSLFVQPATKDTLSARVMVKNEAGRGVVPENFLFPEVAGGPRREKGFERALRYSGLLNANEKLLPGEGTKLDLFGNIPGSRVRSILEALASESKGANVREKSEKGKRGRGKITKRGAYGEGLYVGTIGRTRGIWQRTLVDKKAHVKPLFIFTTNQPNYVSRLPFERIARTTAAENFKPEFDKALNALLAKA